MVTENMLPKEEALQVVLFGRIEDFSTIEDAIRDSTDFLNQIPETDTLFYKIESNFYKEEPIDHPYFTIEATYIPKTLKEAFTLLHQLNALEIKSICNKFTITLKNF